MSGRDDMKALVYEGPREMHVREVEVPTLEAEEVLIRVAYSGICGSELSGYLGHNSLRRPPLVFGHEFSGTVAELGEGAASVRDLSVGHRVTANPLITCGRCERCLGGRQQLCVRRRLLSAHLPGSNAGYVKVPARFVYPLPENVSLEQGALAEPIACAVRIAEVAAVRPSDAALVMGVGPIGIFAIQVLKVHGVKNILAVDLTQDRLEIASRLGARAILAGESDVVEEVRRATDGKGVEVAVDAVGAGLTRTQCIQSVTSGGRVVFSGLHEAEATLPINAMIRDEVSCVGAFAYSAMNFETALRWLSEERAGLEDGMVKSPLEEGPHWFERLLGGQGGASKVLLYVE
jgi:threonine dehydrogenase-like Zn-dependent dehydrogenase